MVKKRTLLLIAGIVWLIAGFNIAFFYSGLGCTAVFTLRFCFRLLKHRINPVIIESADLANAHIVGAKLFKKGDMQL